MNEQYGIAKSGRTLIQRIYAWMGLGLALTGGIAYYVGTTPAIYTALFKNSGLFIVMLFIQLGIVFGLSFFIKRMSYFAAAISFVAYSLISGLTFSSIFLIYTHTSIAITFFVTAGMFFALALYGYFTKADLSGMGSFLFMGLIGLIIGGVVNLFLHSESLDYLISAFGVIIFSLLTAYDIQKIKEVSNHMLLSGEDVGKVSIIGALTLYLDFVNLFLYLLRFLGKKKD